MEPEFDYGPTLSRVRVEYVQANRPRFHSMAAPERTTTACPVCTHHVAIDQGCVSLHRVEGRDCDGVGLVVPEAVTRPSVLGPPPVPDEAVRIVAGHCFGEKPAMGRGTAREIATVALTDAAPVLAAAELEQFAAELRKDLHRLKEYTHGCLAWRVMNDIDSRVQQLRMEAW